MRKKTKETTSTENNYPCEVYLSFSNVFPMLTKPNPCLLPLAVNCSHIYFNHHRLTTRVSLQQTTTHFLRGCLCVIIAGNTFRYKSISVFVLSLRGQSIFLEHLPKSDMFDSFSSPLLQVLHTPSFWYRSQSPGEKKSRRWLLWCVRNRSFSVRISRRKRELEHFIIQHI